MFTKEDVIHTYTRAEAIEDGVLVDVTSVAAEAGFKFPVAVTRAVWDEYVTPDERSRQYGQSENGRLWDMLWICRLAAKVSGRDNLLFRCIFIMKARQKRVITLRAVIGPGDGGEPVITIMKPDED